jgi:hypothetical protein
MTDTPEQADRPKKDRSPSFPFISLPRAIERARAFAGNHKRSAARLSVVAPTWGYGAKSSGLLQTVAALKAYGLLEDMGSGEERKVQLSDLAWRVLFDSREGAREQAIRDAAQKPRIIAEYVPHWAGGRPSDDHCISELQFDRGFTPDAARVFLRVFDETVVFAKLGDSDSLSPTMENGAPQNDLSSATSTRPVSAEFSMPVAWEAAPQTPKPASPMRVSFTGTTLEVSANLVSRDALDRLVQAIQANRPLLPEAPEKPQQQSDEVAGDNEKR